MHKTRYLRWTQKDIRLSRTAKLAGSPRCEFEPTCFGSAALKGRFQTPRLSRRENIGGADRDRTDDLRLAKPALSQLSYSPEDAPSDTSWWAWMDLNHRPPAYQADALTN
jgi:hypothetical protein